MKEQRKSLLLLLAPLILVPPSIDIIENTSLYRILHLHRWRIAICKAGRVETLSGLKSYLSDRIQIVLIAGCQSPDFRLDFGVPHGSVLGRKMYCMHTSPLWEIIKRYGFKYHCYADDTQECMTLKRGDYVDDAVLPVEACQADISTWIENNLLSLIRLKLN